MQEATSQYFFLSLCLSLSLKSIKISLGEDLKNFHFIISYQEWLSLLTEGNIVPLVFSESILLEAKIEGAVFWMKEYINYWKIDMLRHVSLG